MGLALLAGSVGVAGAQLGAAGVDLAQPAGLGIDQGQRADIGQFELARVDELDDEHVVAHRDASEVALPTLGCQQIAHHDREAASMRGRHEPADALREVGFVSAFASRCVLHAVEDRHQVGAALLGGHLDDAAWFHEHRAEPVADASSEEPDRRDCLQREVALFDLGGAEVEAGRLVDADPRLELAIGDRFADVRLLGAGRDVPVDAPHVVTGLICPRLAELAAVARYEAAVVTLQQAVELARDAQLEAAQHLARGLDRHAVRQLSPASTRGLSMCCARTGSCDGEMRGAGTVDSTRAST